MSIIRGNNAEPKGNADNWSPSNIHGISAIVNVDIELQPLIPQPHKYSAISNGFATPSEQENRTEPVETTSDVKTSASPKNSPMFDKKAKKHLHPSLLRFGAENNSVNLDQYNRIALENGGFAEEHPFLSSRSNRTSIINDDFGGRAPMKDGDADTEPQPLLTMAQANGDYAISTVSSLNADDTTDRLQAARSLENGSISEENDMELRTRLSRSSIRWGVVRMPNEFYGQLGHLEECKWVMLGHLSFGIKEQGVAPLKDEPGYMYA